MLRKKFVYIVVVFVCSIIVLADKYKEDNKNITRKEVVASNRNTNLNPFPEQQSVKIKENVEDVANEENENIKGLEIPLAPKNTQSLLLKRKAYTVSFNKMTNQPDWVAWCLTDDELSGKVSRSKDFYEDPDLPLMHRVVSEDYKGCGYDRGHMAPAADMKFSARAMRECFYMSNICPQNHELNAGGWEKVERACRRWAEKYKKVYIVCGPIFSGKSKRYRVICLTGSDPRQAFPIPVTISGLFCVIVETLAGLSSKKAAANHLLKKRMRTILRIACLCLKNIHDCKNNIKTNQITES